MTRKGYITANKDGSFTVGTRDKTSGYIGPAAQVYRDDSWVWVVTDDYEGAAMMNIETLPFLIRALRKLKVK